MKILLISPPWIRVPPKGYGGIEWVVALLADELAKMGHEVVLYATGDSDTKAELRFVFEEGQTSKMGSTVYDSIQVSTALREANNFDIIHDHSGFLTVAFSFLLDTPVLHTLHGAFNEDTKLFYSTFKDAVYYNAISEYQKSCMTGLNYVDTVYNAIDIYNYPFSTEKEDYLIMVSRVCADKGTHHAIDVANKMNEKLVLVGKVDPVDRNYFEEMIKPRIDGEQIVFKGEVTEKEKRSLLQYAKCFIFPIQWPEPFGLVMAEALACGTPVVAVRNGSSPEVIANDKVGFIVESVDDMIPAIEQTAKIDPTACRDHVLKNFSPETMAERYVKNYEFILEQKR
ncbi:MAG: glycosyltransferase family 4 protein [Rubrobacteridae bacterium]|nr:glycosyltransferase family 4 protein [Rubrobacteridae bacterium]